MKNTPRRSCATLLLATLLAFLLGPRLGAQDRDGDGLSDFHEVHKYRTDPDRADSDGDGVPDSDWRERREFQYVVRTVVQVMRPVTIEHLTDDHQDARMLDETDDYVELEVVHYPFTTVADGIVGDARRTPPPDAARWLAAGPTSDWDERLRAEILAAMRDELGVEPDELDDKQLVETASRWLLRRTKPHDSFTTFSTAFDAAGAPFVPDALRATVGHDDTALAEAWRRDVSAAGMFRLRTRGSCSSSAIYLSGCLRALGVPTRTILTIPLVDANDERELQMVERGITHHRLRARVLPALQRLRGSWASHTFNEVWVGGRWRRLNYDRLGQPIVDENLFGMITHIATFADWADADMPATVGRRQGLGHRDDVFGGPNPYSTISLRDEFGPHCTLENPQPEPVTLVVTAVHWGDAEPTPETIREWFADRGACGLVARVEGRRNSKQLQALLEGMDARVFLQADDGTRLGVGFDSGCIWGRGDHCFVYVPFGGADRRDHDHRKSYCFVCRNDQRIHRWQVADDVIVPPRSRPL